MEDDFDVFLALLAHIVQVQLFIFVGLKKLWQEFIIYLS